jgi:uncharacterized protein YndB with AHSA1/START domain
MNTVAKQPEPNVVIERTYRAELADVWDLWTTKEGFESWWGPQGFRADVHVIEPRKGGLLHYDMVADSDEMIAEMRRIGRPPSHETRSQFSELLHHERLLLSSVIDFLPGVEPYENDILVDFSASAGEVRMTVTLSPLHSDEFSKMQEAGFTSQLTKLDQRFG